MDWFSIRRKLQLSKRRWPCVICFFSFHWRLFYIPFTPPSFFYPLQCRFTNLLPSLFHCCSSYPTSLLLFHSLSFSRCLRQTFLLLSSHLLFRCRLSSPLTSHFFVILYSFVLLFFFFSIKRAGFPSCIFINTREIFFFLIIIIQAIFFHSFFFLIFSVASVVSFSSSSVCAAASPIEFRGRDSWSGWAQIFQLLAL